MRSCRSAPASSLVRTFTSTRSRAREASAATSPSRLCSAVRGRMYGGGRIVRRWPGCLPGASTCGASTCGASTCGGRICGASTCGASRTRRRRRRRGTSALLRLLLPLTPLRRRVPRVVTVLVIGGGGGSDRGGARRSSSPSARRSTTSRSRWTRPASSSERRRRSRIGRSGIDRHIDRLSIERVGPRRPVPCEDLGAGHRGSFRRAARAAPRCCRRASSLSFAAARSSRRRTARRSFSSSAACNIAMAVCTSVLGDSVRNIAIEVRARGGAFRARGGDGGVTHPPVGDGRGSFERDAMQRRGCQSQ